MIKGKRNSIKRKRIKRFRKELKGKLWRKIKRFVRGFRLGGRGLRDLEEAGAADRVPSIKGFRQHMLF